VSSDPDAISRFRTEELNIGDSPIDSKKASKGNSGKLTASGKKKPPKAEEESKGQKMSKSKSGKHATKYASKKKNKRRELLAGKNDKRGNAFTEPQDVDRVIEQSSEDEDSSSSEERTKEREVKGIKPNKKYNKHAEE
jgi:hypothetical protein